MPIENTLLELVSLVLIGGGSYGVSQFYSLTPFDKTWDKNTNAAVFTGIPLVVYLIFRIYFSISFFITSKIPKNWKVAEQVINFVLVTAGISFAAYQPKVKSIFLELYETNVGALPKIIYDISKPNILSAYDFGVKILLLLFGWFVLLFCVELVLRVVLLIIGFVLRKTLYRGSKATTETTTKDKEE